MNDHIDFIFNYLHSLNIIVDKEEFTFQFKSHPDQPSLLAISDTLSFFNIKNGAFKVKKNQINELPPQFIANLQEENGSYFSFIRREASDYKYSLPEKTKKPSVCTLNDLKNKWGDYVLIVEKNNEQKITPKKTLLGKNVISYILVLFAILIAITSYNNLSFFLIAISSSLGLFLSIKSQKELNTVNPNSFIQKFCNSGESFDCDLVTTSNEWKILKYIRLNDLSLVFFVSQIFILLFFGILNLQSAFLSSQLLILSSILPVIPISIYYQKFVVKKWCPICLLLIAILLLQSLLLITTTPYELKTNLIYCFAHLLTIVVFYFFWRNYINTITKNKKLEINELAYNRLKRTHSVFKLLLTQNKVEFPKEIAYTSYINNASVDLIFITNPYCKHCKNTYDEIKKIYYLYPEKININIFFNCKYNNESEKSKELFRNLISLTKSYNLDNFFSAMDFFYDTNKDVDKWLNKYKNNELNNSHLDNVILSQSEWSKRNNINFTPGLVVNSHLYPKGHYGSEDLPFLIKELIDNQSDYKI